jgi:hypothetical protein
VNQGSAALHHTEEAKQWDLESEVTPFLSLNGHVTMAGAMGLKVSL